MMRYITRPSAESYSVFDTYIETTFIDDIPPDIADEIAYKLNEIPDVEYIEEFTVLDDFFTERKNEDSERRYIYLLNGEAFGEQVPASNAVGLDRLRDELETQFEDVGFKDLSSFRKAFDTASELVFRDVQTEILDYLAEEGSEDGFDFCVHEVVSKLRTFYKRKEGK